MTIDQSIAEHRRAHVHRDVRILPAFGCFPFTCCLLQLESMRALACARDDEMSAGPKRRRDVLVPLVGECDRPQLFSGFAVDANDGAFGHRHDLRLTAEFDHYRRSITWTKSAPFPFRRAGRWIESENLAAVHVAADLDYQTSVNQQRRSCC